MNKATPPLAGMPIAIDAFSCCVLSITPRQLGPISRMPLACAMVRSSCSRAAPAAPVSANPPLSTITTGTRAAAQSRRMAGVLPAGVTTIAKSTGCGTSATVA